MSVMPKSQYWALWMWSNLMGSEMLKSELLGIESVKSFVTRSDAGLHIMLINTSETEEATIALRFKGASGLEGKLHTYSGAEYFWDIHARKPLWSRPPTVRQVTIDHSPTITLPKFSINVLELPWTKQGTISHTPTNSAAKLSLQLSLPDRVPSDRAIEAWVIARDPEDKLPTFNQSKTFSLALMGLPH